MMRRWFTVQGKSPVIASQLKVEGRWVIWKLSRFSALRELENITEKILLERDKHYDPFPLQNMKNEWRMASKIDRIPLDNFV